MAEFRTPIGRARGWGPAHTGSGHWWLQRLTAVALLPLTLWFLWFMGHLLQDDHQTMRAWLASPWQGGLLLAYLLTAGYHAALGLQVVIEDYLHRPAFRLGALLGVKLGLAFLALVAAVAVMEIVSGGGGGP